jgi:leucyl-tRNA synthetase
MDKYDPKVIEPKWQKIWSETNVYAAHDFDSRPKYYMLTEFPYPSGEGLHAGHAREYTLGDIMARHKRMQGHNVLFPMGWDAFGLPTENYAIKHKIKPQDATATNTANFKRQMQALGLSFDWDREINTTDPAYYKWTQWLFLQFLKHDLAYQAEIPINWCPKEKTGLANEEVVNGVHERCGTPVEKKTLKQWMLKITAYADRLIEGLKTVDFPPRIADQQINWIGRSEGAEIDFTVEGQKIAVYTTRPDTLAGATFLVLAPEHAAVTKITQATHQPAVNKYVKATQRETELVRQEEDRPKTGVFTGAYAQNPITKENMPVWVADYVLASYGTGAIMAVPAHDERDYAFAQKFDLPIEQVIVPCDNDTNNPPREGFEEVERPTVIVHLRDKSTGKFALLNWHESLEGITTAIMGGIEPGQSAEEAALTEIQEEAGLTGVTIVKKLRWTTAARYCASHKKQNRKAIAQVLLAEVDSLKDQAPVAEDEVRKHTLVWLEKDDVLKALVPTHQKQVWGQLWKETALVSDGWLINSGEFNGLEGIEAKRAITKWLYDQGIGHGATKYRLRDWIFSRQHYWGEPIPVIYCPKDGVVPVPDDQLPIKLPDVEHYEPTDTGESPLAAISDWVNTTCPECGGPAKRETDTMPNWAGSSWYWLRYMDPHNDTVFAAPDKLKYWGMVDMYLGGMEHTTLHLLYSRFWHEFLYDQKLVPLPEPFAARRGQGIVLAADGRKMSKSLGNVINPMDVIHRYGADAFRLYVMFMAPYDETTPWSDERLNGVSRFVYRVWTLANELLANNKANVGASEIGTGELELIVDRATNKALKKVHDDLNSMRFNTMVASQMEYVNILNEPNTKAFLLSPENAALALRTVRALVLMLAPAAPHVTEELWHRLGETGSVHAAAWPSYDPELVKDDIATVIVQVNGKMRGELAVPVDAVEADVAQAALALPAVAKYTAGHEIVKTIVVPRRIVNFVVK